MNPDNQYVRIKKTPLFIISAILLAGLAGWWIGQSNDDEPNTPQSTSSQSPTAEKPTPTSNASGPDVKSLVTYVLPDGWKEATCPSATGSVFVVPAGAPGVDCEANPSALVKISVDPSNSIDCNQLQNVQNVSKHICISEYINGRKSLKAETVYNKDSAYKKATAIHAFYINTGKGVVKVEYVHDPASSEHQAGFEQLAKSTQVKG